MTIILPSLAVAFAAFCVWLTVRIVNRRERWAKWMAGATFTAITLYPLSLGPACWLAGDNETVIEVIPNAYYPILWLARMERSNEPGRIDRCVEWYSTSFRSNGAWPLLLPNGEKAWAVPPDPPDPDP